MSDQPNLTPEQQATADQLRAEHAQDRAAQVEAARQERDAARAGVFALRAQNAFLAHESILIDWHDKELALGHADLSKVVGRDGEVDPDALVRAIDDLVSRMPYLVKPAMPSIPNAPTGPTGVPAGSGRRQRGPSLDLGTLRAKYPAAYGD